MTNLTLYPKQPLSVTDSYKKEIISSKPRAKVAIVPKHHYFLRLKYWLMGYHTSVRPNGGVL